MRVNRWSASDSRWVSASDFAPRAASRTISAVTLLPAATEMVFALGLICPLAPAADAGTPSARGVPFTRSYSHADIGNVPRGSRLGFDRFGRVAVIHDAIYSVLNDSVWLNLAEPGGRGRVSMANVVQAGDGRSYYGARSEWG